VSNGENALEKFLLAPSHYFFLFMLVKDFFRDKCGGVGWQQSVRLLVYDFMECFELELLTFAENLKKKFSHHFQHNLKIIRKHCMTATTTRPAVKK
jgi:hypothetical protein